MTPPGPLVEVQAEMVASVAAVLVAPGSRVEVGEMVMLLESMKMEIPVVVEHAGIVVETAVTPGDVVQEGDVLVVLRPDHRGSR